MIKPRPTRGTDMINDIAQVRQQDAALASTYNTSPWIDTICGRCNLVLQKRNFISGEVNVLVPDHCHNKTGDNQGEGERPAA